MKRVLAFFFAVLLGPAAAQTVSVTQPTNLFNWHPGFKAARFYPSLDRVTTGSALVANTLTCSPTIFEFPTTVDEAGYSVTTLSNPGNVQSAIYTNVNAQPGLLLGATGNIDVSTTGYKSAAITAVIPFSGAYWECSNSDNGTVVVMVKTTTTTITTHLIGSATGANAMGGSATTNCYTASVTFGTWPADLTAQAWSDGTTTRCPSAIHSNTGS